MTQSIQINKQVQTGMREMMSKYDWDFFVTANLNRDTNWLGAKNALQHWHRKTDKELLGAGWQRRKSQRMFFCACCEGGATNLHWHMLVQIKKGRHQKFFELAENYWKHIIPSGSMDIQVIPTKEDAERVIRYATKDLWRSTEIEQFVLSTEFVEI
jgi:hypothetical protein